jgi:hypothetical protein
MSVVAQQKINIMLGKFVKRSPGTLPGTSENQRYYAFLAVNDWLHSLVCVGNQHETYEAGLCDSTRLDCESYVYFCVQHPRSCMTIVHCPYNVPDSEPIRRYHFL